MEDQNRFYVYVWYRGDNGAPFYIGKGTGDRWKRYKTHRSKWFHDIYDSVDGCYAEILLNHLSNEHACIYEAQIIDKLKDAGVILANQIRGGCTGSVGRSPSEFARKHLSNIFSGTWHPNYGNKWNDNQKKHLSDVRINNGIEKGSKNPRLVQVMCVETGKIYLCQQDAADELGLKSDASIIHALKRPSFTAKGKHFVSKDMFQQLDTPEKRYTYLKEIACTMVALHGDV